VTFDTLSERLL